MDSHPILDESVLYLGEFVGLAKYKQGESNVQRYWIATHLIEIISYTLHMILNGLFIKLSTITGFWTVFHIGILHSGAMSVQ